jgi:Ser/Thr protein kinase RdoA (MazF antagonist)
MATCHRPVRPDPAAEPHDERARGGSDSGSQRQGWWCKIDRVMTGAGSRVPDSALLGAVVDRYGLRSPVTVRRLAGGYANDVFLLDADTPVVLHLKHPPVNAASIAWEHGVVTALAHWLPPALAPLPALDGSTWFWHEGRPVWLVPFAGGAPAAVRDRDAVAAVLGRLHAAPVEVTQRPGHDRLLEPPLPPVRGLPEELAPQVGRLVRARDELTDLLTWIRQERRPLTGLTHNDIFEGNVLVEQGEVTALLDWEEANLDWLVWDVATSLVAVLLRREPPRSRRDVALPGCLPRRRRAAPTGRGRPHRAARASQAVARGAASAH